MVDRNDGKLDGVGRPDGEVSVTMAADLTPCDGVNDRVVVCEENVEVLAPAPQWTCMALQRGRVSTSSHACASSSCSNTARDATANSSNE